jgi:transposase-like protein
MVSIPSLHEFNAALPTAETCYQFLLERNVFYREIDCSACGLSMKRYEQSGTFRCNRSNCRMKGNRVSIRKGTLFHESSLNYLEILRLSHLWLSKASHETTMILSGHSPNTITSFFSHFRQLVSSALKEEDQEIGGPELIVEIDETKLGRRKYNRGHRVDGIWILVGIERRENGKIFLIPLPDRSAATLTRLIAQHVRQGSTIHTDGWRGYSDLSAMGYTHLVVNHSKTFKDSSTGACTNSAEGLNSGLKRRVPIRNRRADNIVEHLGEYVWRRQNSDRLFDAFIDALRDIHFEFE